MSAHASPSRRVSAKRAPSAVSRIQVSPSKQPPWAERPPGENGSPLGPGARPIGGGWYIEPAASRAGKRGDPREGAASRGVPPERQEGEREGERSGEEEGRPFLFIRWITTRPRLCFGVALSTHVFFLVLSGILVASGYNLFPTNFNALPLELRDGPWLKRQYAWDERDEYPNRVDRSLPPSKQPMWERAFTREQVVLFYKTGDNVFTKDRLQAMQTIEGRLANVTEFSSYCQMKDSSTCKPFISVLRFFDGTYASVDPVLNDPNFNNIDSVLYAAYTNNETKGDFLYSLGKENEITSSSVSSTVTRTLIPLGWPLPGYSSEDDMLAALTDFMADHMEPVLSSALGSSEFEFTFYNYLLMFDQVTQQAMYDMALALGSMVFIFLFIWFHTRSLWMTCFAELSIVCSFVETNFFYRVVIGYEYFGYFHVLAMFIILGIGADDLFVFWDAWKATGLEEFSCLARRLQEAYKKSLISMLVTSLTTMMAFLANALSPLLATQSFGVFAAILVGINYLSVILFFPTIIIFYHLHFEVKPHPCCCCWGKRGSDADEDDPAEAKYAVGNGHAAQGSPVSHANKNSVITLHGQPSTTRTSPVRVAPGNSPQLRDRAGDSETGQPGKDAKAPPKPNRLVIFFRDYYFAFVTHKIIRWVIVLLLLGCLAGFAYSASKLEPDNEQIQLYTDSHHYSRAIKLNNYGFVPNDQDPTVTVFLVWGLKESDLSGCHFSSVDCSGEHRFDDAFDASTVAAQQAFVSLCNTLLGFTADQIADYAIRRDVVTNEPEIACFTRNMETFLKNDAALSSLDVTMPWNRTKTWDFMTSLNTYYDTSAFTSSFTHYLDIPLTYWIWDKFQQNNTADYQMFNSLFGEENGTFTTGILTDPTMVTGNRIKYMAMSVNTTLILRNLGYTDGLPVADRWEQFMEQQLQTMPPEMQGGFQTTLYAWHWLNVQQSLAQNAVLGIILGLSLALPVLILATCNVFNGLLATLAICCVTVCVIGVIPLGGWKLGVLVSLNMCLVVGLAVDFVVHLAEGYHMSHHRDRKGRLQQALERMGISVFSGACTTLGASSFMLFAKIQFFFQFGIFMFCTIGFSLLFSMGLYVTVMGILGPQNDIGDFRVLFRKCRARLCPQSEAAAPARESRPRTGYENGGFIAMNGSAPHATGH